MVIKANIFFCLLFTITVAVGCVQRSNSPSVDRSALRNIFDRSNSPDEFDNSRSETRPVRTVLASAKRSVTDRVMEQPSHKKAWRPEYAVLPFIDIDGWNITIHNVRHNQYRSLVDYDVRHYDLNFALQDLLTVDFVVVPFKASDLLAHTMLAFGLRDGRHFVVSVEARMEQGEVYSTTAGMRRTYELMYVIGDERDLIPLRTRIRQVECFLYPGKASPEGVQKLFLDIADRVNHIAREPEFYHTLTNNCTTNLVDHVNNIFPNQISKNDWRLILPGRSDRLAFELGLLDIPPVDFESVRLRYRINDQVALFETAQDFSQRIRIRP